MLSPLLITLREGLEAALIIGMLLAFLNKAGQRSQFWSVWTGAGFAVVISFAAGAFLYFAAIEFEGRGEQVFEGITMLLATGILTWMIFWMRRRASDLKAHLEGKVANTLGTGSSLGLVGLAFVVVVREGIETALFLFSASRVSNSPALFTIGGALGLLAAIVIGWGLYKGSARLNLRLFFSFTSVLLIVFAAGLLAHGIHEFQEAGLLPVFVEHVWNLNGVIDENAGVGAFLKALIGYNGNPSLIETVVWFTYLFGGLGLYFLRGIKSTPGAVQKSMA